MIILPNLTPFPTSPRLRAGGLRPLIAGRGQFMMIGGCCCPTPTPTPTPVPCDACGGKNIISGTITDDNGTYALTYDAPTDEWYVGDANSFTVANGCTCDPIPITGGSNATDFTSYYGYTVTCGGGSLAITLCTFLTSTTNPDCFAAGASNILAPPDPFCGLVGPGLLPPQPLAGNTCTPTCVGSPHGTMTCTVTLSSGSVISPSPATFATVVLNY
jgi:hypothetical protein